MAQTNRPTTKIAQTNRPTTKISQTNRPTTKIAQTNRPTTKIAQNFVALHETSFEILPPDGIILTTQKNSVHF